jgi:MtN3 and saliva related transmembrane protein
VNSTEILGWMSSVILIATIGTQLRKQIRDKTSKGVSKWLFAGQVVSEIGFITYSLILKNWVFAATNALLLAENIFGLFITLKYRRARSKTCPVVGSY